jgi:hypothetical protein
MITSENPIWEFNPTIILSAIFVPAVKKEILPIEEESVNLGEVDPGLFYAQLQSPTLLLRATRGLLTEDDLLLPEDVIDRMVQEIPDVNRIDVAGSNHYSILFQPNVHRDRVILDFI